MVSEYSMVYGCEYVGCDVNQIITPIRDRFTLLFVHTINQYSGKQTHHSRGLVLVSLYNTILCLYFGFETRVATYFKPCLPMLNHVKSP